MAVLYVQEYSGLAVDANGHVCNFPVEPPTQEQTIAIGTVSTSLGKAFLSTTKFVRLATDAICSVAFGAAPTAVTTNGRMAANEVRLTGVAQGQSVAVIVNT